MPVELALWHGGPCSRQVTQSLIKCPVGQPQLTGYDNVVHTPMQLWAGVEYDSGHKISTTLVEWGKADGDQDDRQAGQE